MKQRLISLIQSITHHGNILSLRICCDQSVFRLQQPSASITLDRELLKSAQSSLHSPFPIPWSTNGTRINPKTTGNWVCLVRNAEGRFPHRIHTIHFNPIVLATSMPQVKAQMRPQFSVLGGFIRTLQIRLTFTQCFTKGLCPERLCKYMS